MSTDAERASGAASLSDIYQMLGRGPDSNGPGGPPAPSPAQRARLSLPVPQRPTIFRGAAAIWARAQWFDGRPHPDGPNLGIGGLGARRTDAPGQPAPRPAPAPGAISAGLVLRLALLLGLLIAVGATSAFTAASLTTRVYAARSEIAFDLRSLGWDAAERFLATQVVIGQSRALRAPVGAAFGIPIRQLDADAGVETVGSSGVIRLQYANPDRALALEVTRMMTDRYLAELGALGRAERAAHWILTPPFVLDDPIAPKPLRAAALGALAGLLIWGALIVVWPLARPRR